MKLTKTILLTSLIAIIAGCSSTKDPVAMFQGQSADRIYQGGQRALAKEEYTSATQHFEALDALYPFNANNEQAQLGLMYAYYENDDNASVVATAERFIRLYPRSEHLDYVYYLKGLANFNQDRGWFLRYAYVDLAQRDPGTMEDAYKDFSQIVQQFPNSRYASDARQRMVYLRNLFAGYELQVAKYYMKKGAYVAAANRASDFAKAL